MISNIKDVLYDVRRGYPVIILDDKDRENEGDVLIAAEKANRDNLLFYIRHVKGMMYVPCSGEILDRLKIPLMMPDINGNKSLTPYAIPVDAVSGSTGVSIDDRLRTLSVLLDENSTPDQLHRPGHTHLLRARKGLLGERRGHTEASIELLRLAGLKEIAVISEAMNNDGYMIKGDEIDLFAKEHNLKYTTVEDIYKTIYNNRSG